MDNHLIVLKDLLVVLSPVLVAYISYRSSKKSKREIQQEIEKTLKEKDMETSQMLQRIGAELESQKQLASWNNSLPQTNEYTSLAGVERYGNVSALSGMVTNIRSSINADLFSLEDLRELKKLMEKITLPDENEGLYPYEIPHLMSYKKLVKDIDVMIQEAEKAQYGTEPQRPR